MHAALDRRNWVIGQMAENGYITDAQAEAAKAEPLVTQMRALGSQAADVDYYVEEVRRQLYGKYGEQGALRRRPAGARLARHAAAELSRSARCAPAWCAMTAAMAGAAPRRISMPTATGTAS